MTPYFTASPAWPTLPGAVAGCLVLRNVTNPATSPDLEARKAALEGELRARFGSLGRAALAAIPPMDAYVAYYKRFDKSYHVLAQLESVAAKGRGLPRVAALVEAMFMAELESLLLTAGHDLDTLTLPVCVDTADGSERYTVLRGDERAATAGDMLMRDGTGVISTVLHGPDRRTAISATTRNALFAVYAPPGVGPEAVRSHLELILTNARLVCPAAQAAARELR